MGGPRRRIVGLLAPVLALVVAGCSAPAARPFTADRSALQAVVVSTSIWPGEATILVALSEADATPISGANLAVTARLAAPPPSTAAEPMALDGRFVRPSGGSRDLVRLDASLPASGRWELEVTIRAPAGSADATERRAVTSFTVEDPAAVPTRGDPAPAVATPTLDSVGGQIALVTSDTHPEPSFYERSVVDALDTGSPFVLILDSAGFRESEACGSALVIVHRLPDIDPSITLIHAEPFRTRVAGDRLTLDPPGGPAALADWSAAWGIGDPGFGIGSIPWVFVVDRNGVVAATFQGVMGSEELSVALADVANEAGD
ncbi:MAG TPA: hypothetical protein VFO73_15045 [Candidatus Limnocylindrales bacterium]|nr:hypothetical protein [Candidatus Limnocylindrales bacterium]